MDSIESATQLTLALMDKNPLFTHYKSDNATEPAKRVSIAFDTILCGVVDAINHANQPRK
jgi:hypothetical protein